MKLLALLALTAIFPYMLQATPPPQCIHNINPVNNIQPMQPGLSNLNFKQDRLKVLSKQSLTFIKNNYGYIGSIIVLVAGVIYWYNFIAEIHSKNAHPYRLDRVGRAITTDRRPTDNTSEIYPIPNPSKQFPINASQANYRSADFNHHAAIAGQMFDNNLNSILALEDRSHGR